MSALNVNDIVRILNNPLSWRIVKISGPFAVLESGQTGIRRRELVNRLTQWQRLPESNASKNLENLENPEGRNA